MDLVQYFKLKILNKLTDNKFCLFNAYIDYEFNEGETKCCEFDLYVNRRFKKKNFIILVKNQLNLIKGGI